MKVTVIDAELLIRGSQRPGERQRQRGFAQGGRTKNAGIFVTPPDELDANRKSVIGKSAANDGSRLARLIEYGGVGRDF